METVTVVSRKGGVGKTTSVINLSYEFGERLGLRTLIVDFDPQSTLTLACGYDAGMVDPLQSVTAAILPERFELSLDHKPEPVTVPWAGVKLLPASRGLADAETYLGEATGPTRRLAHALARYSDEYDLVLVDTPPSLGRLVMNGLGAADHLLIPITPDYFAAAGLALLLQTIDSFRHFESAELEILGIFATIARRTAHSRETALVLERELGEHWLQTMIPQAVSVQYGQLERRPIAIYEPDSKPARAYRLLADELVGRLAGRGVILPTTAPSARRAA